MKRCTDVSEGALQKTRPSSPTERRTPRLTRLPLEGIMSRRSCHEKETALDGARAFQTLETTCKIIPLGAPVVDESLER